LNFDSSSWEQGTAPIGYDPSLPIVTRLDDMRYNYTTVFFRKQFVVPDPSKVNQLMLRALYDDGFKIWITGPRYGTGLSTWQPEKCS
jgi:hypothetical protein